MTQDTTTQTALTGETTDDKNIHELLRILPAIYHDAAETPANPFRALLLVIQGNFKRLENEIDTIERYFDVTQAPAGSIDDEPDFLTWLSTWVGLELDDKWSEAKKRYAIKNAVNLHKYRGTVTGLTYMLALYFNIDVEIIEWVWPEPMEIGIRNTIGVDSTLYNAPDLNSCFTLTWKPGPEETGEELTKKIKKIRDMIDREKPAHTSCYFHVVRD